MREPAVHLDLPLQLRLDLLAQDGGLLNDLDDDDALGEAVARLVHLAKHALPQRLLVDVKVVQAQTRAARAQRQHRRRVAGCAGSIASGTHSVRQLAEGLHQEEEEEEWGKGKNGFGTRIQKKAGMIFSHVCACAPVRISPPLTTLPHPPSLLVMFGRLFSPKAAGAVNKGASLARPRIALRPIAHTPRRTARAPCARGEPSRVLCAHCGDPPPHPSLTSPSLQRMRRTQLPVQR